VIQSDQTFLQFNLPNPLGHAIDQEKASFKGLLMAIAVIGTWATTLFFLLTVDVSKLHPVGIVLAMLVQTFLYTGLFITAHDAMHGAITPQHPKLNNLVGSIVLIVYGLFSYKQMIRTHWQHHHHPASEQDPDYHDGKHTNFFAWYFHFMKGYWSWWRLFGLIVIYHTAHQLLHVSEANLTLFWMIPSIASSLQLFYFGTFQPHQEPEGGYDNPYRAKTNPLPIFWSFITCYHFGYHKEHHEFPHVPWWGLPAVYKLQSES
jgi:beta-carotene/zeaxanthin 4-ketolase